MTKTASVDALGELHALLASSLSDEVKRYQRENEPIPPALLAQVIKFLKDNGIEAVEANGNPLEALTGVLPFPTDSELSNYN